MSDDWRVQVVDVPGWRRAQTRTFEICGDRRGPVVTLVAGLDGTAYAGIEACWRLLDLLKTVELTGTVRVIPVADIAGFLGRSAHYCPLDDRAVIRAIGHVGSRVGESSENLEANREGAADAVARSLLKFVVPSDFHIDLRGGGLTESHAYWVAALAEGEDLNGLAKRAADACGARFRLRLSPDEGAPFPLGSAGAVAVAGIPSLVLSAGGPPVEMEKDACILLDGVMAVLRVVGVVPTEREPAPTLPREVGPGSWTHLAQHSGLWIAEVEAGERIDAGQDLGQIWDYFGNVLEEVIAPFPGWVLAVTTSMAVDESARGDGDDWYQRTVTVVKDA